MNATEDAFLILEKRLEESPVDHDGWMELARLGNQSRRSQTALMAANNALTLRPGSYDAFYEAGLAALDLGRPGEAEVAFTTVLARYPTEPKVLISLGNAFCHLRRFDEAALVWEQAAKVSPEPVAVLEDLAVCHQRLGDLGAVSRTWRRVLGLAPGHPTALHHLAALGERPVPTRAAADYVVKLFDDFAVEFDGTLDSLGYDGPRLIAGIISRNCAMAPADLAILDAGCGTGLSGGRLRPWAANLAGVDLSPGMLAKAKERGIYDELHEAEMVEFLKNHPGCFDLVTAVDSLNYCGDLAPVFDSMASALRSGGRCAFSVERHDGGEDYRLEIHGRFSHHPGYIRRCLEAAGLRLIEAEEAELRKECGNGVIAGIFLAER